MNFIYEDELPKDISKEKYDNWFKQSWVDGVRIGPQLRLNSKEGWCDPAMEYFHSVGRCLNGCVYCEKECWEDRDPYGSM